MKPINAEEIVRVFNGWLEEADSLAEREAIECCMKREWSHSGPMPEVWRENYLFGILPERTGLHNPKRRKSSETLCIQKRRTKRERSGL